MNEQRDKDPPHRGRGRSTAAGSSAALRGLGERGDTSNTLKMRRGWKSYHWCHSWHPTSSLWLWWQIHKRFWGWDHHETSRWLLPACSCQLFQELEAGGRGKGDQSLCSAQEFVHWLQILKWVSFQLLCHCHSCIQENQDHQDVVRWLGWDIGEGAWVWQANQNLW